MNKQNQFAISALLLVAIAVIVVIFSEQINDGVDSNVSLLIRDYSPNLGNKDAKVTIVEFFDPAWGPVNRFILS